MFDRETMNETGDGGAGMIVAGLVIAAILVVGFAYLFSLGTIGARPIDIDVPKVSSGTTPVVR